MKKAFTLAEILIVLIIIGVVSLLTVPALVDLYKFRDLTARYQRIYAELTTAFTQAAATANYTDGTIQEEYYDADEDEYSSTEVPGGYYATIYGHFSLGAAVDGAEKARQNLLTSYLGLRRCQANWGLSTDNIINCFSKQYESVKDPTSSNSKIMLPDFTASNTWSWTVAGRTPWGASVLVYSPMASQCTPDCPVRYVKTVKILKDDGKYETHSEVKKYPSEDTPIHAPKIYPTFIFVDTNGIKGPNVTGYDAFIFQVAEDGSLTDVIDSSGEVAKSESCGKTCSGSSCLKPLNNYTGFRGCVTRVEENGGRVKKFTDAEINGG